MARCQEHGLAYDPSTQQGCVLCRRALQPVKPPKPPLRWGVVVSALVMATIAVTVLRVANSRIEAARARLVSPAEGTLPELPPLPPPAPGQAPPPAASLDPGPLVGKWKWLRDGERLFPGVLELDRSGKVRYRPLASMPTAEGRFRRTGENSVEIAISWKNQSMTLESYDFVRYANRLELRPHDGSAKEGKYVQIQ